MNHTSDAHPWFEASRSDPTGPYGDYYVWSDSDELYADARIIFVDTEQSNWTFDPIRRQFFWHRFFSHQPDLNFDNPAVKAEMFDVVRFWLDLGIDGFRLDAVPYLFEEEGTNCENLPRTHDFLRELRTMIDTEYPGRIVLAEANQWPQDVVSYYGTDEEPECHMCFHFPVMPRIFYAIREGSAKPIVEILAETPEIPAFGQWGTFLRNHDELTLEMVTGDERAAMYGWYAPDPRMRANIGIRRRLATLLDNSRAEIELINALLLSLPGSPCLYYGDEIGMGDNIWLNDRDAVRTPMQWTPDRNAGFSTADPGKLYLPVVESLVYHYNGVNVEAQLATSSSLLHWVRGMLAIRKRHPVFGLGRYEQRPVDNDSVMAYLRVIDEPDQSNNIDAETVLCLANMSGTPQACTIDLSDHSGRGLRDLFGGSGFPAVGEDGRLTVTLGSRDFFWLRIETPGELHRDAATPPAHLAAAPAVVPGQGARGLPAPGGRDHPRRVRPRGRGGGAPRRTGLGRAPRRRAGAAHLPSRTPRRGRGRSGGSHGARAHWRVLGLRRPARRGLRRGPADLARDARGSTRPRPCVASSRVLSGEQSNTSVIVAEGTLEACIVKVFRTLYPGSNPDVEVAAALTRVGCHRVAEPVGWSSGGWTARDGSQVEGHLAVAAEFLAGSEDAWREAVVSVTHGADFTTSAAGLGEATAQVHVSMAEAFGHRAMSEDVRGQVIAGLRARVAWALDSAPALEAHASALHDHATGWTRSRTSLTCSASTATTTWGRCSTPPSEAGSCWTSRGSRCGPCPNVSSPTWLCATWRACSARSTTRQGSWAAMPRSGRGSGSRPAGTRSARPTPGPAAPTRGSMRTSSPHSSSTRPCTRWSTRRGTVPTGSACPCARSSVCSPERSGAWSRALPPDAGGRAGAHARSHRRAQR